MKSQRILEKDGWTVMQAEIIEYPYANYPKKFSKIFSRYLDYDRL
jgi:spermidine synthase